MAYPCLFGMIGGRPTHGTELSPLHGTAARSWEFLELPPLHFNHLSSCCCVYVVTMEACGGDPDGEEQDDPWQLLSFSAFILNHVSPNALAKWSSTEPANMSLTGSDLAFMAVHVVSPSDLAKWSSTEPETNQIYSIQFQVCNVSMFFLGHIYFENCLFVLFLISSDYVFSDILHFRKALFITIIHNNKWCGVAQTL